MSESRLFQILYYLLGRGEATAPELAEKFEVSTRTIYRDIDRLSGAGIPIYTTTGHKGGVHLDENFVLKRSILSKEDMEDILMGVQSLSAVGFSGSDTVISKLQALFQMRNTHWIEVDYSRWGCDAQKERVVFGGLKEAIQRKRQIRFQYYNAKGEAGDRECWPVKLFFKDRAWYLYAYCLKRKAGRMFRLSRIRELEITEQVFDNIPEEVPPMPQEGTDEIIEVELRFDRKAAYRVYDIFDEKAITETAEALVVKTAMPKDEWLSGFLMSFGDGVTIVSPAGLKEEIKERLKAAIKHYET